MDIVTRLQTVIHGPDFRVYANPDVIGVELAGACKNVVAIAAGVCEAAGFGHNGLGGIMSRGLCEITRLGVASGAQTHTFLGLAGMGDLVTTCSSPHGRNRRAGTLLAQGKTADEVRAEIGQVVEGLRTAPTVAELATRLGVTANICAAVAAVAQQQLALEDVVPGLLHRPPSLEFDPAYGWAGEPVGT
jgi:glycerol-3-phosphate dehydrogenase (NAD(P)+)